MPYGRAIRDEWLLEPQTTFLNHGSFGACPRRVLVAQDRWRTRMEAEPVRFIVDELPGEVRRVAARLGAFMGARGQDVVPVENATTGVNAVIQSFDLRAGDEIVTTSHVYGAVNKTLRHHAKRAGAAVIEADVPFPIASADQVVDAVAAALTPRTKLAVLDHVTSFSGLVYPIEALVGLCRARGIPVLVDGAHAPGLLPLDLEALGADWYTGNLHKWVFAPKGCAFLWAREDRQRDLHPTVISHGYGAGFTAEFDFTGTKDATPWLALDAALDFVAWLGVDEMRAYQRRLAEEAAQRCVAAWGIELPSPASMRAAMVTMPWPGPSEGTDAEAKARHDRLLSEHGIEVPVFTWFRRCWLRISAQVYNEAGEYDRLVAALR